MVIEKLGIAREHIIGLRGQDRVLIDLRSGYGMGIEDGAYWVAMRRESSNDDIA